MTQNKLVWKESYGISRANIQVIELVVAWSKKEYKVYISTATTNILHPERFNEKVQAREAAVDLDA